MQYSEFRANPAFRASARCSKMVNDKIFQCSEKCQGNPCFSGQAQVPQKSLMAKNSFNTVENFTANSAVFQDKCEKNLNTVYSAIKCNYRKVSCQGEHNT